MDYSPQLDRILGIATNRAQLLGAMELAAEGARQAAVVELARLRALCTTFAAGQHATRADFEQVSMGAHLGAFSLISYGQVAQALAVLPPEICGELIAAGQAVQDRAHELESKFLQSSLSPSELFFDDLYSAEQLSHQHAPAHLASDMLSEPGFDGPGAQNERQPAIAES